ncbi:MAG: enoyl- hydratase isomerase family [Lasallia pustulata]|uniref:Probable enoyl-CoA hydratase, mitochondrial n=1 Tax=Lasallia pustulata TaxID=136370 RepID=A0A5M8PT27_9LECA|nr:MAG: enoyl- hydratase isomerase family [Lasallia pustulata]
MNSLRYVRPLAFKFTSTSLTPIVRPYSASTSSSYEHLLVSSPKPGVTLITINRPKALNALSSAVFTELNDALRTADEDTSTGAVVLTGSEKAFAAGADIKEMKDLTFSTAYNTNFIAAWSSTTTTIRTPFIAAVNGYALGGGCELALMADILYCSTSATFGQPEIKLGIIPGAGGSQRLTRAVGKSRAMELILTGRNFSGKEAGEWGVAARVFESAQECVDEAVETAEKIAKMSRVSVRAAKEVVNRSQELSLRDGVEYERKVFHSLFGSKDQKIGMAAFAEKKKPEWSHE